MCPHSILHNMQSKLEDFGHLSRGLMADLEMCEERQNKVDPWPLSGALHPDLVSVAQSHHTPPLLLPQVLDNILLQPNGAKREAAEPLRDKDQMVLRSVYLPACLFSWCAVHPVELFTDVALHVQNVPSEGGDGDSGGRTTVQQ